MVRTLMTLLIAALCATRAHAQPTTRVRLELRLIAQVGTPGAPGGVQSFEVQTHPDIGSPMDVARRFEVQYRLMDLDQTDQIVPAGLASARLRLTVTNARLGRAGLSQIESGSPAVGLPPVSQPVNLATDFSPAAANGSAGLHRPFRDGIPAPEPNNEHPSNGVIDALQTTISEISPLALFRTDQYAPTDPEGGWYGLYSFNMFPLGALWFLSLTADLDSATNSRFAFFSDDQSEPVLGVTAIGDTAIGVPGPGPAVLMVLAAAAHRRRCTTHPGYPLGFRSRCPCIDCSQPSAF